MEFVVGICMVTNKLRTPIIHLYSLLSDLFPPNPQAEQKERSHSRLGFFKE